MEINVYGCGGTGMAQAIRFAGMKMDGLKINVIGMLASEEDIPVADDFSRRDVFLVPGIAGSGQVREENYEEMRTHMPQAMNAFPPADMNIIMFSTFGGSGSIMGPLIAEYCLTNNHQFTTVASLGDFSLTAAKNTTDTLGTLEGIAQAQDAIVPMIPIDPSNDETKRNVEAGKAVDLLMLLYSGQHSALDVNDLKYWLQHGRHSEMTGRCNVLRIAMRDSDLDSVDDPLSVITLLSDEQVKMNQLSVPYHTKGYGLKIPDLDLVHFALSEAEMDKVTDQVKAAEDRLQKSHNSRIRKPVDTGRANRDGFVMGRR